MKSDHKRQMFAATAVVFGLYWVVKFLPSTGKVFEADGWGGHLFALLFCGFLLGPGVVLMVSGVRLFREFRESSLKWIVGIAAFVVCLMVFARMSRLSLLEWDPLKSFSLFLFLVASFLVYLFAVRALLRQFTEQEVALSSLVNRGVLILLAWALWSALHESLETFVDHRMNDPLDLLVLIAPILVAYGTYRFAVSRLTKVQSRAAVL